MVKYWLVLKNEHGGGGGEGGMLNKNDFFKAKRFSKSYILEMLFLAD